MKKLVLSCLFAFALSACAHHHHKGSCCGPSDKTQACQCKGCDGCKDAKAGEGHECKDGKCKH